MISVNHRDWEMDAKAQGKLLREERCALGYSNSDFCAATGVSVALLGKIERGVVTPGKSLLAKIETILSQGKIGDPKLVKFRKESENGVLLDNSSKSWTEREERMIRRRMGDRWGQDIEEELQKELGEYFGRSTRSIKERYSHMLRKEAEEKKAAEAAQKPVESAEKAESKLVTLVVTPDIGQLVRDLVNSVSPEVAHRMSLLLHAVGDAFGSRSVIDRVCDPNEVEEFIHIPGGFKAGGFKG